MRYRKIDDTDEHKRSYLGALDVHELSLLEHEPPLVGSAILVINDVEKAIGKLLADLVEVLTCGVTFRRSGRGSEETRKAELTVARESKVLLHGKLRNILLGFSKVLGATSEESKKLRDVNCKITEHQVSRALLLEVAEQDVSTEELNSLINNILVVYR